MMELIKIVHQLNKYPIVYILKLIKLAIHLDFLLKNQSIKLPLVNNKASIFLQIGKSNKFH